MTHILDVDNTIYLGSTVRDFLRYCLRKGVLPYSLFLSLPVITIKFLISEEKFETNNIVFPFLKGISESVLLEAGQEIFNANKEKKLNSDMLRIIELARNNGEKTLIATSSFRFIIKPIAEYLGIADIISVDLEYKSGLTTGKISGIPPFGENKKKVVKAFMEKNKLNPDHCSFYTDSHRDLPLLEYVGHPVAVFPNRRLKKIALKENWEIIENKKERS